jgi:hypothetical protein
VAEVVLVTLVLPDRLIPAAVAAELNTAISLVELADQVSSSFATQQLLELLLALVLPQLQQSLEPMKSQQLPQVPAT